MIHVAILSFWHVHAKDYALQAEQHPEIAVKAIWDENPERGAMQAEARQVPFYADLEEVLANPDIDAVIVTTATSRHREVILAAARAGKHIFTEKVLATTTQEAKEIVDVVEQAGVKLTVSLPRLNTPFAQAAQEVVAKGLLGKLTQVRVRMAHKGALSETGLPPYFYSLEQAGGGAMIDLGCHPMYLTRLLLGMPETLSASYGYVTGREVEDNAVAVLRYAYGALGIVETGFVNPLSPLTLEAHGTKGSMAFSLQNRKLVVASLDNGANPLMEWPLPEALPSDLEQWVSHIQQNTVNTQNLEMALDLTRLMEASNLSAKLGRAVELSQLQEQTV
ncbi:Gfo/Idh/MocA family protein [Paenibacillus physcomitrellae]|uniref:Dehydrogenase n=1 Tax=Paenibacillus physcomitrellae TaxID=1619311 RepID=A0ABQ1FUB0_9BACL|nr:Gfo/Idh/MocA family oxidoreductase [Paenibacillus physcomitrellae]GGA30984.1 dehydrogenase [Paenibacillus physcomitrellae]